MGNHFHLIVECGQPALSKGMERLNGLHASGFNARHGRVGHLFQRRFESRPIADDEHLENACEYVRTNPVRAALCGRAAAWPWSGSRRRGSGVDDAAPRPFGRAADPADELVGDRAGDSGVLLRPDAVPQQSHRRPHRQHPAPRPGWEGAGRLTSRRPFFIRSKRRPLRRAQRPYAAPAVHAVSAPKRVDDPFVVPRFGAPPTR